MICPTEKIKWFCGVIFYDEFIMDCYDKKWADKLINQMKEINSNKPDKERKKLLLFIDDVVSDDNFHQSPSLKKLIVRRTHINIAIILTF